MDNIITITTDEGTRVQVEVLDIFSVKNYEDKDYILYTQNASLDEENIKVYISILEKENEDYRLVSITDEQEWIEVQKALEEMEDTDYE